MELFLALMFRDNKTPNSWTDHDRSSILSDYFYIAKSHGIIFATRSSKIHREKLTWSICRGQTIVMVNSVTVRCINWSNVTALSKYFISTMDCWNTALKSVYECQHRNTVTEPCVLYCLCHLYCWFVSIISLSVVYIVYNKVTAFVVSSVYVRKSVPRRALNASWTLMQLPREKEAYTPE